MSLLEVRILALEQALNRALARLAAVEAQARQAGQQLWQLGGPYGGGGGSFVWVGPAVASTVISAYSAGTAGQGSATLETVTPSTGALASGASVTVFSNYSSAVASGKNLTLGQDTAGNYWLLGSDC